MTENGSTPPRGHVKVARKLFATHPFWLEEREFSRFEAWLDVIQLAAFKDGTYRTANGVYQLARGQFIASRRWLARRWNWTEKRVRVWLEQCQNRSMLKAEREAQDGTLYLIVNYDHYQTTPRRKGPARGQGKGPAGAQQGPKIEAGRSSRSSKSTALSPTFDEQRVVDHYAARHPTRRPGDEAIRVIRRSLGLGYSADDLIAAIDGNADDEWHRAKSMHDLAYVLRNRGKIDDFRGRASNGHEPLVDPITGGLTAAGIAAMGNGR
jgi:hypothetical protein